MIDTHAVNHHIYKMAPDPFTPGQSMLMVTSPSTLVAISRFEAANLQELVARAKAESGKVTYATAGAASSNHLGALLLEEQAGIRMTHVHYKGGGPMIQALLGQQIDIAFISTPLILPHIQAGRVKPIAVGGKARIAVLPCADAVRDYPGFEQVSWFGILAPSGTPREVTAKVHREMGRTLAVPEVRKVLEERGFEVIDLARGVPRLRARRIRQARPAHPPAQHRRRVSGVAFIVGAGSGLSGSLGRLLEREGFDVALAARNPDKLQTKGLALRCDATDRAQVEAAFEAVERKWGVPDLVVYNASYRHADRWSSWTSGKWRSPSP